MSKKQKGKNESLNKQFEDQFDDEDVLFTFRKHPIVMRKGLVLFGIGPLLGLLPTLIKPELGFSVFFAGLFGGIVLGGLFMLPSWIAWYFSIFIVTNMRLIQITQRGLFNRSVVDLALSKIQSTNYEVRGVQATLFGFGTIVIQTYMGDMVVHEVHKPAKVIRELAEVLRDQGIKSEEIDQDSIIDEGEGEA